MDIVAREADGPCRGTPYRKVGADGNCFFYAVSLGHFGSVDMHETVRRDAREEIRRRWHFFGPLDLADRTLDQYMEYLKKGWGGSMEAMALSELYKRRILFIQTHNGVTSLDLGPADDPNPIILRYSNGDHFDLYLEAPAHTSLVRESEPFQDVVVVHDSSDSSDSGIPVVPAAATKTKTVTDSREQPVNSKSSESDVPLAQRVEGNNRAKKRKRGRPKTHEKPLNSDSSESDLPLAQRVKGNNRPRKRKRGRPKTHEKPLKSDSSESDLPLAQRAHGNKKARRNTEAKVAQLSNCESSDSDRDVPLALRKTGKKRTCEEASVPAKRARGRPKKKKRGRPKQSQASRGEQLKQADKKRAATPRRLESRKQSSQNSSQAHVEAAARYQEAHPEGHRESAARYQEAHPEGHRESAARYQESHPEVNRESGARYREAHSDVRAANNTRYRAAHPNYEALRYLSPLMRSSIKRDGPAGFWAGEQLQKISLHTLVIDSLFSPRIHKCKFCKASLFEEEKGRTAWCCGQGAYNVVKLPALEHDFYESPPFLDRARAYNDVFAFCAMGVTGGYRHPSNLAFLKIEGRMYHKIYSINSTGQSFRIGRTQQYINHCRMYMDDGEERRNIAAGRRLNHATIQGITEYLNQTNNEFIRHFKLLAQEPHMNAHLDFELTSRDTHGPALGDRNRGVEVHAVLNTDEAVAGGPRKLTVWKKEDAAPSYIDVMSPLMEPMQYPLLYPHGTLGWHINKVDNNGKKLSQYSYVRCLMLSHPRFFELGRLSQAWMVEMFARYEEERLWYITRCQKGQAQNSRGLRVAPMDELQDQMGNPRQVATDVAQDETIQADGPPTAGKIYLPSSFTGSPRYMRTQYHNAMGLVARKGKPTYFLTFTATGSWNELRKSTRRGSRCDPATCCRIFQLKLQELLRDVRSGAVFGPQEYNVHVIEMQMRGLPHAHMVVRCEDGGPVQGADIDRVIRADIPGPEEAGGRLRALVLKYMIHGPCGTDHRTDFPCWDEKNARCSKMFPKPASETTYVDDRGFVHYKRDWNNKAKIKVGDKEIEVHDGWVVPYNPYLLLRYGAHINLELASTRKVICYLFKYLHKGSSLQNVRVLPLHQQQDEPEQYATRRMIGASDACWRLLGFDLTVCEPSVDTLPIHLEGQQSVVFRPGNEKEAVDASTTKLLVYLGRPADAIFDQLTYQYFYENYIVHTRKPTTKKVPIYVHPDGKHYITPRQRKEKVTRLFWIPPSRGEIYYLRVLLAALPARGYAELKALGGRDCTTFQEAARFLGLADNEKEYLESLQEAATFMTGPSLRAFFVLLCNIGAPGALLWDQCKDLLSVDHLDRNPNDSEKAYKLALIHIDRALRRNGSRLTDHGLPDVEDDTTELGRELLNYSVENQQTFVDNWLPRLDKEQRALFEYVKFLSEQKEVPKNCPKTLYLSAPGGYGKTAVLKVITSHLRSQGKVVLCVASSGIAALNMEGGTTAHSMFRLPLDLKGGTATWNVTNGSQRAELIRAASLIIFDEAPMAHKHLLELLDRSLRDLMGNDHPFGNKILLCAGDWRQTAPIVEFAKSPNDIVDASLKSSELWSLMKTFTLKTPQRARDDPDFAQFLLEIGDGRAPQIPFDVGDGKQENLVALPGIDGVKHKQALIDTVYPPEVLCKPDECAKRAILAPLNVNVNDINNTVLDMVEGPVHEMRSYDAPDQESDDPLEADIDLLNQATAKGVPPHNLRLKVGAVCLITRNLNVDQGLVNGTKVIVEAITRNLVRVRIPGTQESFGIPRITFRFPLVRGSPLVVMRRQFPLQLAYAMTIHKSQGQTIFLVGIDLRTPSFTHGQLYVGLSRVRCRRDIKILVPSDNIKDGVMHTKNIVYLDLLD